MFLENFRTKNMKMPQMFASLSFDIFSVLPEAINEEMCD